MSRVVSEVILPTGCIVFINIIYLFFFCLNFPVYSDIFIFLYYLILIKNKGSEHFPIPAIENKEILKAIANKGLIKNKLFNS